jgi:hypothetical protein
MLKELIKIIQQEHYTYSDPITEFLECLYVNYDFEGAQEKLRECEEVMPRLHFLGLQLTVAGVQMPSQSFFCFWGGLGFSPSFLYFPVP